MRILIYLTIGFVLLFVYVRFLEAVSLFHPVKRLLATPADVGIPYEDVYFSSSDHTRLHGWLIKAENQSEHTVTLIYCHGNAGNIGDRVEKMAYFREWGFNVFIFDYRGYGKSQGRPTEQGLFQDAKAAFEYVYHRKDLNRKKIVFYGASIGGCAAIDAALTSPVAAMILESTFSSASDMAKVIAPFVPTFMLAVKFDSIDKIDRIKVPKLFIHSPMDEVVPYRFGKKLFDAAVEPKMFLEITGHHNDGYIVAQDRFFAGIKNFLSQNQLL